MERSRMLVAGYFRISQARDDMKAPDIYLHEIDRYCRYKGLDLVETFSDIDYSGYRVSLVIEKAGGDPTRVLQRHRTTNLCVASHQRRTRIAVLCLLWGPLGVELVWRFRSRVIRRTPRDIEV
jgi:hypothetical protein